MRICSRAILATIGVLATAVRPAGGQVRASADVAFNSQYIWRGVTSTNRLVIQPSLTISAPLRGLTVLAGAWGNVEPVQYDGAGDLSSLGGLPGPLVTQSEAWLEVGGTLGNRLETAVGVQGYFYPHVGDLADYNTVEVYASAGLEAFLSPSIDVAYDVGRIRGAYVEAGLSRGITGERRGAITLELAAGYSAGQAEDPRDRDLAYFERDGLTHVDASTTASFSVGRIAVAPEAHIIFAHDAYATVTGPAITRRTKLWIGTTLSWTSARQER